MTMRTRDRLNIFLLVFAVILAAPWLTATALADAPATSKELCQQKIGAYVLPSIIRDNPNAAIRDVTPDDLNTLRRVFTSQCMLSFDELSLYWNGKSEAERAAFFTNYSRISSIITDDLFNFIFPNRQSVYTRESFIKSAMAFPALCGEDGETDETCKREFATMFAHWLQETSGLQALTEGNCVSGGCENYLDIGGYFYNQYITGTPPPPDFQYWGRGPKQLSWNGNYGRFSWGYFGGTRSGTSWALLERPSLLLDPAYIDQSFVSAFWFYMTPISQKPSMHEVVTGKWRPNSLDIQAGITPGFGATIDIINGAIDCNKPPTETVQNRIAFYVGGRAQNQQTAGTLAAFGLQLSPGEVTSCENMRPFPTGGAGTYPLYLNLNRWSQCELYTNESLFTVYDQTPLKTLGNTLCSNGLDCCQKVQPKLKQEDTSDLPPMVLNSFVTWMGGIPLDIKASASETAIPSLSTNVNGNDTTLTVRYGEPVTFTLSMEAENQRGTSADWWLAARSLIDGMWYIYDFAEQIWRRSATLEISGQYRLASLDPSINYVTVKHPEVGEYYVYFAIDTAPNGLVDPEAMAWDRVKLVVLPN